MVITISIIMKFLFFNLFFTTIHYFKMKIIEIIVFTAKIVKFRVCAVLSFCPRFIVFSLLFSVMLKTKTKNDKLKAKK